MTHHAAGLARVMAEVGDTGEQARALGTELQRVAVAYREQGELEQTTLVAARERALLAYALKLTATPARMVKADVDALREAGFDDGEILDANQVTAYYAYVNRLVDGLGVELESFHR